jgi:hypothetical protein
MALSDDHRLAVAFSRSDGTTQCPASGDGCPKILVAGISVVDAGASTIPDPSIKPASGCSFGALTWSQAHLLAVEECPISSDAMYADRRVSRLVRIDPADGKRLATIELPSDYPVMDRVDGMRTLSNGDILVSMGSAKVGSHLLRVHDYVATAIEMHGNFVAESP